MPIANLSQASIRYEVSGTGDPTVLVHGSLTDRGTWEPVRSRLAPSLTVLAYDRRGHGESTGSKRSHPVRDDTRDLSELLEALDLFPVHVIAHSYGGAIGLRLAADRPEMVRSLLLHEPPLVGLLEDDPATAPEAERLWAALAAMQSHARTGQAEVAVREVVDALSGEDGTADRLSSESRDRLTRHVGRWVEEMDDPEATRPDPATLSDLLIPVLLTTGERSAPYLHRIVGALAGRLRNASVRTLPGVGHVPHREDPEQFIALVQGFLVERTVPST